MREGDATEVGVEQLEAILRFLPVFEQPGYGFGEWESPKGQLPFYSMSHEARDFVQALYEEKIVTSFDWPSWQEEARRYIADPKALETADLLTLRKLLTMHLRKERFAEGHLADMLESGHITAILRRLRTIREQLAEKREEYD
jgi:hypothetical protein